MPINPEIKDARLANQKPRNYFRLSTKIGRVAAIGLVITAGLETQLGNTPKRSFTLSPSIASGHDSRATEETGRQHKTEKPKKKHCTSIRRRPKDIQMGFACSNDAGFKRITGVAKEKGWVYGVIGISGIWKCGFVREGVLPDKEARARSVAHCKDYYRPLAEERYVFFEEYNCPEVRPGLEGCNDGTFYTPTSDDCPAMQTYHNYETDEPSPLNLFGTGNGGFSDPIRSNKKSSFHYRVKIKSGSQDGHAIVIRAPEWGLAPNKCADAGVVRLGGPKTLK